MSRVGDACITKTRTVFRIIEKTNIGSSDISRSVGGGTGSSPTHSLGQDVVLAVRSSSSDA